MLNKYYTNVFFLIILFLAFIVRLHEFNGPIADWHSWRQADTSAVSRNFIKFGFDILHPKFDDLSNVPSGIENPKGYRFVEFPIYNIFQAGLFSIAPFFTIEEWGRIVTIISSELTILFLFLIVRKYTNNSTALITSFIYAFLPYNIYYGRTILPDPSMIMCIMGAIYFFDLSIQTSKLKKVTTIHTLYICISLIFASVALLLKPFAIFFFIPMVYLAWHNFGKRIFFKWHLWLYLFLVFIPIALWRLWIVQFPEGIPASTWLFNGGNIRFRPAFFRWILFERLTKLFLGYVGLIPLFAGIFANWNVIKYFQFRHGQKGLYYSFMIASILYVIIVARGNVQHDYYQIPIMPSISLFLGLGSMYILQSKFLNITLRFMILLFIMVLSFYFSWGIIGHYFDIDNHAIVNAGHAVDITIPKNAKVIAPYGGDTSFLYQTNRQGWASFEFPLPELIKLGASYLVLVNPIPADYGFAKDYKLLIKDPHYLVYDLKHKS